MKLQQLDKALFLFFNNSNFQFLKIKHTAISINSRFRSKSSKFYKFIWNCPLVGTHARTKAYTRCLNYVLIYWDALNSINTLSEWQFHLKVKNTV